MTKRGGSTEWGWLEIRNTETGHTVTLVVAHGETAVVRSGTDTIVIPRRSRGKFIREWMKKYK